MHRIAFLIICAAIVSACETTPPRQSAAPSEAAIKECTDFGVLGAVMMSARQQGKPKAEVEQAINRPADPKLVEVAKVLVDAAYQSPIYETKEAKDEAVKGFALETTRLCLNAREKAGLK